MGQGQQQKGCITTLTVTVSVTASITVVGRWASVAQTNESIKGSSKSKKCKIIKRWGWGGATAGWGSAVVDRQFVTFEHFVQGDRQHEA